MIQSALLTAIPNIRHGFFTREGGHSSGLYDSLNCSFGSRDDPETVKKNRETVAARMGIDADRLMTVWQSHSPDVIMVEAAWDVRRPPEADAMVTRRPGIALGVLTADCTPILFADRGGRAVGVAHAGWKGALDGVLEQTIAAFDSQGVRAGDLHAAIGPTIGQANYEVGPEFFEQFLCQGPGQRALFRRFAPQRPSLFRPAGLCEDEA
jgi:polyphenol oxidase